MTVGQHLVVVLVAVAVLAAVTFGIVAALRLEKPWLQPIAILRAVVQLGILTLILVGVITSGWWVAVFLAVMVLAASWVVMRRLELAWRFAPLIVGILAVSSAVPVAVVFAVGAVEPSARYVLALGGIVVGNAMTVTTLAGRSLRANLVSGRDEIEGWLALGAPPRHAVARQARVAASTALIPSTDQTRTTGIVTLPGAFVGALFGGASPLGAAEFQVVVLGCILLAGALSVTAVLGLFGAPKTLPLT